MVLNIIKMIIALFSTVFMVDCKLTGEGHFGIQCLDQIRVFSVDDPFTKRPHIHQNGQEISVEDLDNKQECLLPLCSCIHPAKLRWHKVKDPELYERCFYNQCDNLDNECLNKPNGSKCMMRNRMCIDINDWCGVPAYYPSLAPFIEDTSLRKSIKYKHRDGSNRIYEVSFGTKKIKLEYEINCDNGRICCRYLLGTDISKKYYKQINMEWILQTYCGRLHAAKYFKIT